MSKGVAWFALGCLFGFYPQVLIVTFPSAENTVKISCGAGLCNARMLTAASHRLAREHANWER